MMQAKAQRKPLPVKRIREPLEGSEQRLSVEPGYFLFVIILAIFVAEMIIMTLLPHLLPEYLMRGSILDAFLLVILIIPALYFFSFRPMRKHIMNLDRIRQEMQRSEERYRSLVESTEDSIYLVDKEYKYLFMNSMHQARTGLSPDQFIGRPYSDFHSPEGSRDFEKMIDQVFRTGRSVQQEHKSQRDNRYFVRTFSPVKDPFGLVEAVSVVSKDVTMLI